MTTSADSLGKLPTGWCWATFSTAATIASNLVPPKEWLHLPHIAPDNIERDTGRLLEFRTIAEDGVTSSKHLFKPGQVLYSKIRPYLNKCVRVDFAGLCSADMYPLDCHIDTAYLHYYILSQSFVTAVSKAAGSRTVLPKTNQEQLADVPVPVAPAAEQLRLVEALDSYTSDLDNAVTTLERVQRNLKRYRASVLKAAVEGRLVPTEAELARAEKQNYEPASELLNRMLVERRRRWEQAELAKLKATGKPPKDDKWKSKYQAPAAPDPSKLAELPEGWCWATVDQLVAVGTGATPNRGRSEYWTSGNVPWVTSGAVNLDVVTEPSAFVTRLALEQTNLTLYAPGTLIVAMYGEGQTRGRCTELRIPATTNQALAALVFPPTASVQTDNLRRWLRLFFEHNYISLRSSASGGVQPNLNLSIVREINVPLPPTCEQLRIADETAHLLSVSASSEIATDTQITRCKRLRQAILKWAFDGKLVEQDPSDEPAAVLLNRIRAERGTTEISKEQRRPRRAAKSA